MSECPEKNGCGVLVEGKGISIKPYMTELEGVRDETDEGLGAKSCRAMIYKEF